MNPLKVLREAIVALPQMKWALGVAGLLSIVALVRAFNLEPSFAIGGSMLVLGFMVLLVVFASVAGLEKRGRGSRSPLAVPALTLLWAVLSLFVLTAILMFTSVFFDVPITLRDKVFATEEVRRKREIDARVRNLDRALGIDQIDPIVKNGRMVGVRPPSSRARELAQMIPSNSEAYALAIKAIAEGRHEEADRYLQIALKDQQVSLSRIVRAIGLNSLYQGNIADAISSLTKAHQAQPKDVVIQSELGLALALTGEVAKGAALLTEAYEVAQSSKDVDEREFAEVANNLGIYKLQTGAPIEARALFEEALALWSSTQDEDKRYWIAVAKTNLAMSLGMSDNPDDAFGMLEEAIEVFADLGRSSREHFTALNTLAGLFRSKGQYDRSEQILRDVLKGREDLYGDYDYSLTESYINLANVLALQGKYQEALPIAEKGLVNEQQSVGVASLETPKIRSLIGVLRCGSGDPEGLRLTEEWIEHLSASKDQNPLLLAHAYANKAKALALNGETERSLEAYAAARPLYLEVSPKLAEKIDSEVKRVKSGQGP